MPTLRFFGREFETSIRTDEMSGKEFRDFMDEVIRMGLLVMEARECTEKETMAQWGRIYYDTRVM